MPGFPHRSAVTATCLLNHPVRPGLFSGKMGWFHAPLDIELMREGAALSSWVSMIFLLSVPPACQAKSPVKHLHQLDIARQGDTLIFDLAANGFLHHMVRNIVGCLVYVGKGKYPPEWMAELLHHADRTRAAPTFAPDGLVLFRRQIMIRNGIARHRGPDAEFWIRITAPTRYSVNKAS